MLFYNKSTWLSDLLPEAGWSPYPTPHLPFEAIGCNLCSPSPDYLCFSLPCDSSSFGFSYHHFESRKRTVGSYWGLSVMLVQSCMMGNYIGMYTRLSSLYSKRAVGICLTLSGDVSVSICFDPWCLPIPIVRLRQQYLQCLSLVHIQMSCWSGHSRRHGCLRVCLYNTSAPGISLLRMLLLPHQQHKALPSWAQLRLMQVSVLKVDVSNCKLIEGICNSMTISPLWGFSFEKFTLELCYSLKELNTHKTLYCVKIYS